MEPFSIKNLLKRAFLYLTKWFRLHKIEGIGSYYLIPCSNSDSESKELILFGWNDQLGIENYGNEKSIKLGSDSDPYRRLFNQSASSPFNVVSMRLIFKEDFAKFYHGRNMAIIDADANGDEFTRNIQFKFHPKQPHKDTIDITQNIFINSKTKILFNIAANSELLISFYSKKTEWVKYSEYKKRTKTK